MARYVALVGKRVEVHYRTGDIYLPAVGTLVADSGKSIFLEESLHLHGSLKSFRWEVPYPCIVKIQETAPLPASKASNPRAPATEAQCASLPWGVKRSAFEL